MVKLIKPELDERIVKIVAGWPRDFQTDRAHSFGFKSETNFEQILVKNNGKTHIKLLLIKT